MGVGVVAAHYSPHYASCGAEGSCERGCVIQECDETPRQSEWSTSLVPFGDDDDDDGDDGGVAHHFYIQRLTLSPYLPLHLQSLLLHC